MRQHLDDAARGSAGGPANDQDKNCDEKATAHVLVLPIFQNKHNTQVGDKVIGCIGKGTGTRSPRRLALPRSVAGTAPGRRRLSGVAQTCCLLYRRLAVCHIHALRGADYFIRNATEICASVPFPRLADCKYCKSAIQQTTCLRCSSGRLPITISTIPTAPRNCLAFLSSCPNPGDIGRPGCE